MLTSNETEVGVSEVKATGYDKLLASRVEGRVSSRRLEGVRENFMYRQCKESIAILQEVPAPLLRCTNCGMHTPVAILAKRNQNT